VDKSASFCDSAPARRSSVSLDARMNHRMDHGSLFRLFALCVGALGSAPVSAAPIPCDVKSAMAGPCFKVHGRLQLYNGTPSIRIWHIGTNRLLGVTDGEGGNNENPGLPPPLDSGLDWNTAYVGDYTVCPRGPDKPGTMRTVCVQAVAHLVTWQLSGRTGSNNRFERSAECGFGKPSRGSTMWINQLRLPAMRPRVAQPNR